MIRGNSQFSNTIVLSKDSFSDSFICNSSSGYVPSGQISSMAIDAEWYWKHIEKLDANIAQFLTKQYSFSIAETEVHLVLWHQDFLLPDSFPDISGVVIIYPCDVENTTVFDVASQFDWSFSSEVIVYMYYSPVDIMGCLLDRDRMKDVLKAGQISKKRNHYGTIEHESLPCKLKLRDLLGAFNTGLDRAFSMVGIDQPYKDLVSKDEKSDMRKPMRRNPNQFLAYALGDTAFLSNLWATRVKQINELIEGSLGFSPSFDIDNCPRSSGSLVSQVFNMWLANLNPDLMIAVNVHADIAKRDYSKFKAFKKALKDCSSIAEFDSNGDACFSFKHCSKSVKVKAKTPDRLFKESIAGLARGSIKALGKNLSTASLNAIVMGGRCNNEKPDDFEIFNVLDIDLKSCYGSALTHFEYPIGRPKLYGVCQDDEQLTLGEFLKRYESDLVDNLWQIVVEGGLSFSQDLIYSKLNVSPESIRRDLNKLDDFDDIDQSIDESTLGWDKQVEAAHIKGDFVLCRNEIKNGIITADLLRVIRQVSSTAELKGWMSLKVSAAAWYSKEKQVDSDTLTKIIKSNPGSVNFTKGDAVDRRVLNWTSYSLNGFVGSFVKHRNSLKGQVDKSGDSFDILQEGLKLFINTTYGCLASPYFPMGNVILANNITARARLGAWMMNKSLGTVESITDGGAYSNDSVRFLDPSKFQNKKPGFDYLSDYDKLNQHRSISTGKLTEFEPLYQTLSANPKDSIAKEMIDRLAKDHIDLFWLPYGLSLQFTVEHKYENTAKRMVYWGSSDYVFLDPAKAKKVDKATGQKYTIKVRGAREDDHVKKLWLLYLSGLSEKPNPHYGYSQLVGLNQWLDAIKTNALWPHEVLPGEELNKETYLKINTLHGHKSTAGEQKKRQESHYKAVRRFEKGLREGTGSKEFGILKKLPSQSDTAKTRAVIRNALKESI